jgi:hypothetical protein
VPPTADLQVPVQFAHPGQQALLVQELSLRPWMQVLGVKWFPSFNLIIQATSSTLVLNLIDSLALSWREVASSPFPTGYPAGVAHPSSVPVRMSFDVGRFPRVFNLQGDDEARQFEGERQD